MRIGTGLGGKVIAKAGGAAVLTPAAEIYSALERGVIDAAEWVAPHDDLKLGLHKTALYYYYPGWHELSNVNEFTFNRKAYEALPVDLRRTLDHAVAAVSVYGSAEYNMKNAVALERLKTEFKGQVEILRFPAALLRDLKAVAAEVIKEQSERTPIPQGSCLLHEVPGARGPLGPRRRRRLPPARGRMMKHRLAIDGIRPLVKQERP
jgi:TRAP-type mannitol/chloroaromatic compound transport system substrate-binding protein